MKKPKYNLNETIELVEEQLLAANQNNQIKVLESIKFHLVQIKKNYAHGGPCHCVLSLSKAEFEGFVLFQNQLKLDF